MAKQTPEDKAAKLMEDVRAEALSEGERIGLEKAAAKAAEVIARVYVEQLALVGSRLREASADPVLAEHFENFAKQLAAYLEPPVEEAEPETAE